MTDDSANGALTHPATSSAAAADDVPGDGAATQPLSETAVAETPRTLRISAENAFSVAFVATLGVLVALLLGTMVANSVLVITYIGAALFFALGLEPLVRALERLRLPRPAAIFLVFIAFMGAVVGVVFIVAPAISMEFDEALRSTPIIIDQISQQSWFQYLNTQFNGSFNQLLANAQSFASNPQNLLQVAGGIVSVSASIVGFIGGAGIIIVLTLYFMASLRGLKTGLMSLVPASKRRRSSQLIDRVFENVGKYVISQAIISLTNALCAYIAMTLLQIRFREVLAVLVFLCALLPLIGSSLAATITTLATICTQVIADPHDPNLWPALFMLIYYIIYIQIEAYVLVPRVVNKAVPIPGIIVVIAALLGGALLGVFGALLSIPVAASVIYLVQELWVSRQNER